MKGTWEVNGSTQSRLFVSMKPSTKTCIKSWGECILLREREREGEMDGKEWKFSDVCIVYYIFFLFFFILSNKEKGDLRLLVKERTITRGAIFFWGAEELIYVHMRTMDCLYQSSNCKIHWNYYFLENKHTFCCLICQTCKKKTHWNFARERIVRIKILSTACWKILFCWKNSRAHTHTLKKTVGEKTVK